MKPALCRSVAVSCSAASSGLPAFFALAVIAILIKGLTSHEDIDACVGAGDKVSNWLFACNLFAHARHSTLHAQLRKIADLHRPIWKPCNDLQLAPHRLDVAAESR